MLTFGAKLKGIRNLLNLSQAELARRANLHRRDVIQFENDVYLPSPSAQTALEEVLGVSFDQPIVIPVDGPLQSGQMEPTPDLPEESQ